jgi:2-keto-4-pentenoate hydratase/2-oxohepta-3-ene-1,7-dioic acid hydratase in catechol pathway
MKIASFKTSAGAESYGVVVPNGIVDIGRRLKDAPTLRAALATNALSQIASLAKDAPPDYRTDQVTFLPPIPDPEKVLCIGLNYRAHAAESGAKIPENPSTFVRLTNTLVAHGGAMTRSKLSSDFDYEGELAAVIGKRGKHISEADALKYVAGYSCFNDASFRDYQFKHSLAVGKNFIATGGFGPWLVTTDEIPDPSQLTLKARLNGQEVQNSPTDDLIFSVSKIIAYLSAFTELAPGDVIATGTPHGVGFARKPPLWMKPGDVIEVEISKIGVLSNTIEAEA